MKYLVIASILLFSWAFCGMTASVVNGCTFWIPPKALINGWWIDTQIDSFEHDSVDPNKITYTVFYNVKWLHGVRLADPIIGMQMISDVKPDKLDSVLKSVTEICERAKQEAHKKYNK